LRRLALGQLINARPIYWLLRCSIRFGQKVVHRQSPSHGLTTPVDRLMRCHPLTLIVRRRSLSRASSRRAVCVARLSSFQRTDGGTPVALHPTSSATCASHRPGPAWKASPPVGRGVFRGTF